MSDDSSLKAAAVETPDGHWSHEDWLAKESSQNAAFQIHEKLGGLPALTGSGAAIYSGPEYYGTTAGKAFFPTYDMIRIESSAQSYHNTIHVDPCCPSLRNVTNDGDTAVNAYVCVSGMVTRAKCGIKVISMSATYCAAGACTGNLGFAEDENGRTIGQDGDSGAPVYSRPSSSTAKIHGMEIAGNDEDDMYFHKISRMEAVLDMDVAHS